MKFNMTNQEKYVNGQKVNRIKALVDIPSIGVRKGDLGGYIQSHSNLSQEGNSWVGEDAVVIGDKSSISGNAVISGKAFILNSVIKDEAKVYGEARVNNSEISENVTVSEKATVVSSKLMQNIRVFGDPLINFSTLSGALLVKDDCAIENSQIFASKSTIQDNASLDKVSIGTSSVPVQNILLAGVITVTDCNITGSSVSIMGDAIVQNGVHVQGGMVIIRGFAHLNGIIHLQDEVEISELAQIINRNLYPINFKQKKIKADTVING